MMQDIPSTLEKYMLEYASTELSTDDILKEIKVLDPSFSLQKIYYRLSSVKKIVDNAYPSWKELYNALGKIYYMDISYSDNRIFIESENGSNIEDKYAYPITKDSTGCVLNTEYDTEEVFALFALMSEPHVHLEECIKSKIYSSRNY